MDYQHLTVERRGAVGVVRIHRPPVNALSPDLMDELLAATREFAADEGVRSVVFLSALPGRFLAGADLMSFAAMGQSSEPGESPEAALARVIGRAVDQFQQTMNAIADLPKPTVAAISGHALGGGCEFALACDFRLMDDGPKTDIGLTEVTLGLVPGAGGTQRLPRLIGESRAMAMILLGQKLNGAEAKAIGLVHEVFPEAEFEARALAFAERLAAGATLALGTAKRLVRAAHEEPLAAGLKLEAEAFVRAATSEDAREGLTAFFSRRPPEFKGR